MDEKTLEKAKAELAKAAIDATAMTEEEIRAAYEAFELARQPIELRDGDLELGPGEPDLRGLSQASVNQMFFRLLCNQMTYAKSVNENMIDIMRLLMVIASRMGVESIQEAVQEVVGRELEGMRDGR